MSKKDRVLIIDKMHHSIIPMLEEIGYEVEYLPEISREEVLSKIDSFSGMIVRSKTNIDQELIDRALALKFVARAGAGIDKLDIPYLDLKGIKLLNAPEGNRDAVGEHALGMLLNLLHNISKANEEVKRGSWNREQNRGIELKDRVVGIYGFGNTGASFAQKLSGLSCEIIAYDKYKEDFSNEHVKEVDEDTFRENVEILSIHVPLNEETRYLFNKQELLKYPNLRVILNTSRGEVLVLKDLVEQLEAGKLLGAGLDVLENEKIVNLTPDQKIVFEKLASNKNVLLTPHIAGWTHESYERINGVLVDKIKALDSDQANNLPPIKRRKRGISNTEI